MISAVSGLLSGGDAAVPVLLAADSQTVAGRVAAELLESRARSFRVGLLAQRLRSSAAHACVLRRVRLAQVQTGLKRAADGLLAQRRQGLSGFEARLQSVDPQRVLARGYAWLADPAGRAVTSATQVAVGDELHAVLADGTAAVRVTEVSGMRRS